MKRRIALSFALIGLACPTGWAAIIDLTTDGSSGSFGDGALYVQANIAPTGSGVIQSFVRINPGGGTNFEQGYNTDGRALQYDENSSPTFTRALPLAAVPIVTCAGGNIAGCTNGVQYREFRLDINQTGADPLLSLNRVVILQRGAGNLLGATLAPGTALGATPAINLFGAASSALVYDSGFGNRIDLNYLLESGSGQGDMFLYIPDALFSDTGAFIYLYSEFGGTGPEPPFQSNDGFEEWAVRSNVVLQTIPEPTSVLLLGTSLIGVCHLLRKRFAG